MQENTTNDGYLTAYGQTIGNGTMQKVKYCNPPSMNRGSPMIAEDEAAVVGRKKICGLMPYQGRMVIEFMSIQTGAWKESQIRGHLMERWGRGVTDRGKITFFCRCIKDSKGRRIFEVTGTRPRNIRYLCIAER